MSEQILECARLRSLRLARGMSQRELGRRLGVTTTATRSLEEGRNHNELSLRFLQDLARALGVPPAALLPPASNAPDNEDQPVNSDVLKLGAIAAAERTGLSTKALATIAEWKLDRLANARGALDERLRSVGMRLALGSSGWKLQPDMTTLSWQDEMRLGQVRQSERGLRLREAELLRAALDGSLSPEWEQHIGNADRVALGGLLKSGLVMRADKGVVPSASVVNSLHR